MTAYGGELRYTVRYEPRQRSLVIDGQPDVVLQGNGIFLEHYSQTKPPPRAASTITVTFREVQRFSFFDKSKMLRILIVEIKV